MPTLKITAPPVQSTALDRAYTVAEACAFAGMGRSRFLEFITSGHLVARKAGRRTLILSSDLQAFLQALPKVKS